MRIHSELFYILEKKMVSNTVVGEKIQEKEPKVVLSL